MSKHLFLDLEDTVCEPCLDGFNSVALINVEKVRNAIKDFNPDHVHIFSFAVYNDFDKRSCRHFLIPRIESAYGVEIEFLASIEDMIALIYPTTVPIQIADVLRAGKEFMFREFIRYFPECNVVMLLDDAVKTHQEEFQGTQIYFQNVDDL